MKHEMKLQAKYFNFIKNGTKCIEIRLYDEKRQNIKLGDTIEFVDMDNPRSSLKSRVKGLLRYQTFDDLFADFDIYMLADKSMTKAELKRALEEFYTPDKQAKYGVLGIRLDQTL